MKQPPQQHLTRPGLRRRCCLLAALPVLPLSALHWPALASDTPLRLAMRRAEALREEAVRAGD